MARKEYNGAWPRVRLVRLEMDNWLCQIKGPHCKIIATEVDHIIGFDDGGARLDLRNLRSTCRPCHNWRKTQKQTLIMVQPDAPPSREW